MAISEKDLENLLTSLARIIDRYGDAYWPIFERLEQELEQRQTRRSRITARLKNPPKPHPIDRAELS